MLVLIPVLFCVVLCVVSCFVESFVFCLFMLCSFLCWCQCVGVGVEPFLTKLLVFFAYLNTEGSYNVSCFLLRSIRKIWLPKVSPAESC